MSTNYTKMKAKELSDLCAQKGLEAIGTRPELIARLKKAQQEEEAKKANQTAKKDEEDDVNVDDTDNVDIVDTETPTSKTVSTTVIASNSNTQTSAPPTQTQATIKETPSNVIQNAATNTSNAQQQETTIDTQPVDEETRKKMRAERFKIPVQENEVNKAIQRAARFGLPLKGSKSEQSAVQNRNPTVCPHCPTYSHKQQAENVASAQKKAQRAERFGKQVFAVKPPTHADRLQQRQQRFGNKVWSADEEEKKRKRAERFTSGADKKIKTT